jgi:hypothetical protein
MGPVACDELVELGAAEALNFVLGMLPSRPLEQGFDFITNTAISIIARMNMQFIIRGPAGALQLRLRRELRSYILK